jgi:hypothetical protein
MGQSSCSSIGRDRTALRAPLESRGEPLRAAASGVKPDWSPAAPRLDAYRPEESLGIDGADEGPFVTSHLDPRDLSFGDQPEHGPPTNSVAQSNLVDAEVLLPTRAMHRARKAYPQNLDGHEQLCQIGPMRRAVPAVSYGYVVNRVRRNTARPRTTGGNYG